MVEVLAPAAAASLVRLRQWLAKASPLVGAAVLAVPAAMLVGIVNLALHVWFEGSGMVHALALPLGAMAAALAVLAPVAWIAAGALRQVEEGQRRLQAEAELHRQAEDRFRDIAECSSDWLWETDEEHRFTYFSERHREVNGLPPEGLIGHRRCALRRDLPPDGDWDALLADLEHHRPFRNFRYAFIDPAGRMRITQISGKPIFDDAGRFRGYRGIGNEITEQYEQEVALREGERQLSRAQRVAKVGDWRWTLGTQEVAWSRELYRVFGVTPETFEPTFERVMAMVHPADLDGVLGALARAAERRERLEFELRIIRPDGEERHLWTEVMPEEEEDGAVALFGIAQDVTERKRVELALRASEERFRDFAESASDWLWEMDAELRFSYFSERLKDVAGMDPAWFIGRRRDQLVPDAAGDAWRAHLEDLEARRPFRDFVYRYQGPDGVEHFLKVSGVPVFDHHGRFAGYRGTGADMTERVRSDARFRHLAHHDELTGLPNRALFQDRLRQALAHGRRHDQKIAVLQLDLDRFKDVNDTLGHAAGDALLREVARRLEGCVRGTDTVARLGGDEFAVILTELAGPAGASRVAQKVIRDLVEPVEFQGQIIHTGASIGVTIYPTDGTEPDLLLKNADIALYEAKDSGRNAFSFFLPQMKEQVERRKRTEVELRRALARGEFILLYQPQISLVDGGLRGFEALLRWRHPERGLVSPGKFIAVAEDAGLTVPIGQIVLRLACAQARSWLDAGHDPGRIAVNLTMAQFRRGGLAETIEEVLRETGVPPGSLELEITEGVLMDRHKETVYDTLSRVHRLGVSLALDDFGTGYASLSHLKHFHVDRLKIDQSFVRDIGIDPDDAAIVRAVINLGHSLDLEVVAEGVEAEEQCHFLRINGCDLAQGYCFAPPLLPADAAAYLQAARPQPSERPPHASLPRPPLPAV